MDIKNLSIIRQSFASTEFTHKVQEVAAENRDKKVFWIKMTNILLVAIVLILLSAQAFVDHPFLLFIGIGITIAEIVFLIVQLTFNFNEQKVLHKSSALKYLELRDKYKNLITDVMNESITTEEIIKQRDKLQNEYRIICDFAPQTDRNEYTEAQKRLNKLGVIENEDFTWSDEEIDRFLPEALRLSKIK